MLVLILLVAGSAILVALPAPNPAQDRDTNNSFSIKSARESIPETVTPCGTPTFYKDVLRFCKRTARTRFLKAGTEVQAVATYNNSRKNPHNPDPDTAVHWGDQTYDEMMVGLFDIATPVGLDKSHYFIRQSQPDRPDGNSSR